MRFMANAGWLSFEIFSAAECDALLAELHDAAEDHATVYGLGKQPAVHSLARRTTRLCPSLDTRERVTRTLESLTQRLSEHFDVPLATAEEPQFLRYTTGDYFVAHQDGNTPIIVDDSRHRRVSLILFLSDRASYSGGELVFHRSSREVPPATRGTILAFRSELTHEVTPVTAGERYTIVTWYR
jgi:SM-20-related protein